jgi:hypothetical protein
MQARVSERPWEKLADIRRTRDAFLLAAWFTADVAIVTLIAYLVFGSSGGWWQVLIGLCAVALVVKYSSRLLVTLLVSTSWYRLVQWLMEIDEGPGSVFLYMYVCVLASAGIFVERAQQCMRARRRGR